MRYLRVLLKFCQCVSLVRDLALLMPFFRQKANIFKGLFSYILQDFLLGIGIWFWAVENLGSHHMSVFRDPVVSVSSKQN